MAINAGKSQDTFSFALELFSSLYQDMSATDLPAGLSPDNQNVWYLPGSVQSRPALNKLFTSLNPPPVSDVDTVSLAEYAAPTGDFLAIWLYSNGDLYQRSAKTGAVTQLGPAQIVTPGSQFRSVTAFNKQWFAFFNQQLSSATVGGFTDSDFVGAEPPRYLDQQGNVWRVTQDAPAVAPVFANVQTSPFALVQTSTAGSPLTVTSAETIDPVTTVTTTQNPNPPPALIHTHQTVYQQLLYGCSTAVPSSWLGQTVVVTGFTGSNAYLANITGQIVAVSGSTFTLAVNYTTFFNISGSATATLTGNYLTRSGNIVTAYVGSTQPPNLTPGFYVNIGNGGVINGPNWTISAIARDSTGLVTVTISTQLTNLPSGAQLFISATDTTDFPPSTQTVYQVLSATGGNTTFTISNPTWGNGAVTNSTGGSVYQVWSGVFEILSVGDNSTNGWYLTYFQLGPDSYENATGAQRRFRRRWLPDRAMPY